MCLGIPMQVLSSDFGFARCLDSGGSEHEIDVRLVGDIGEGDWVLVFLGAAREILDPQTAKRISDALTALDLVMKGETDIDHLFADLLGPDHDRSHPLKHPAE